MDPNTFAQIQATYGSADWTAVDLKGLFAPLQADDRVAELKAWACKQAGGGEDFRKSFDQAYRYWLADELLGGWPESVTDMVARYMEHRAVTVGFNGLMSSALVSERNKTLNLQSVIEDLRLAVAHIGLPFRDKSINDAVSRHLRCARDSRIIEAFKLLDGGERPQQTADFDKVVAALVNASGDKGSVRYARRVIETMMWQVLRRLANDPAYPVENHLMMLLCGPQGAGKTQAIRTLLKPIHDLVLPTNFKHVTDGRDLSLPKFPVVFLDEMESAERSDMEAVKNAITRDTASARVLHTNDNDTVRTRNVFIGATNGTLGDKITDTTGLRRFAPIQVKHAPKPENIAAGLPVVDWGTLNDADIVALWRSVDWRGPHPLQADAKARAEWLAITEAERNQDSVEAWLRQLAPTDLSFKGKDKKGKEAFTTEELRNSYAFWCNENGHKPLSTERLGKRLNFYAGQSWFPFDDTRRQSRGMVRDFKAQFLQEHAEPARMDSVVYMAASRSKPILLEGAKHLGTGEVA